MSHTDAVRSRVSRFVAVAAGATLASSLAFTGFSSGAGADVQRYQTQTMTVTVALFSSEATSGNVHIYSVTMNPCDSTFTGTGGGYLGLSATTPYVTESVSGSYLGGSLTLNSTYDGTTYGTPYTYVVGPVSVPLGIETPSTAYTFNDGVSAGNYPVYVTVAVTSTSSYANHGAYVSSNPGSDAAHACLGMPTQSQD